MRIAIVDDDTLVALSLKTILETDEEITVVGLGNSGEEAVLLYENEKPDVMLMDIRMDKMTGLKAAERILFQDAQAKILFLTTFSDDEYIIKAIQMGVKGYILKQDYEGIIPAIKAVYGGQTVFGKDIVGKISEFVNDNSAPLDYNRYNITGKEQEIIEEVALGLSNKEIAEKLFLSEGTVRNYVSAILEKLDLRDRTQLAVFYYRKGEEE
jgi:DNA-binding NarL/FixJ family response regulator